MKTTLFWVPSWFYDLLAPDVIRTILRKCAKYPGQDASCANLYVQTQLGHTGTIYITHTTTHNTPTEQEHSFYLHELVEDDLQVLSCKRLHTLRHTYQDMLDIEPQLAAASEPTEETRKTWVDILREGELYNDPYYAAIIDAL